MASQNKTDLRRARQHARAVTRSIFEDIKTWLQTQGVLQLGQTTGSLGRRQAHEVNKAISRIAGRHFQQDLSNWLQSRRKTTMARAARAAFQSMQQTLPRAVEEDELFGTPNLTHRDDALNQELSQIDAALLYGDDTGSLKEEIGNRVTRQIRIGFSKGENVTDISDRVEEVLLKGDTDSRQEHGVSGMTAKSKAELISHDSIQDGYVTSSHRRYLQNGMRYGVYDAVIDRKTSAVCERFNEVIVDLVEDPWLLPPNHPWCRSDIRPRLRLPEGQEPISEDDIGEDHLNTIWGTNGYRPSVVDTSQEFNPTALNDLMERAG